jgi:class III poly(R)-hydroxyalkanoic acid synthase PhaE subunit
MGQFMSTPTLGYTREWQGDAQRWGQLWLEHLEALREYSALLSGTNLKAAERLQAKLGKLAQEGKTPDSLRAFYDLWVDAGEEAYGEIAMTQGFTKAQANLSNTLMAVKRQEQKMVDEVLSALNMPTRRELDTSHRRVHQLRRQVWRLQESLEEAGILELRQEVAALRREVEALRASETAAAKPALPRKAKSSEE